MVDLGMFKALQASQDHSSEMIRQASRVTRESLQAVQDYLCVVAVGSYGRGEASEMTSDFEWLVVYDDAHLSRQEADLSQATLTREFARIFGRERLSINKTFGEVCAISDLGMNVGGTADTNRKLTYRMLILTEGRLLSSEAFHDRVIVRLAETYAGSYTAGHRLLSLATEVARYWRTLRIDYKFKVDEGNKPWGVRSIKLRSSRRFSYLSSAVHFVAFGPRVNFGSAFNIDDVTKFMKTMSASPTTRLCVAIEAMGSSEGQLQLVLEKYEEIHAQLCNLAVRTRLDKVKSPADLNMGPDSRLLPLVRELHGRMAELILALPTAHRQQLVEMFLL